MAMSENEARLAMLEDWMARLPEKRQTEHQAAVFAMKAMRLYPLRAHGDRYAIIMRWLKPYLAQPAE